MVVKQIESKIIQQLQSQITLKTSIRALAKSLYMNNSLAHRNIATLIQNKIVTRDEQELISINYKENHELLAYCEYQRTKTFLEHNKQLTPLIKALQRTPELTYTTIIIFGSTVNTKQPNDLDLLIITEKIEDIEQLEQQARTITQNYPTQTHIIAISRTSAQNMLVTREQKNVMNETLNKHIIIKGAEQYYSIISQGRK